MRKVDNPEKKNPIKCRTVTERENKALGKKCIVLSVVISVVT